MVYFTIDIILLLAGYFAYSALFAAIGSAVGEDINDANSLTFPIMMPLIFSIYIGFSAVARSDSSLAIWAQYDSITFIYCDASKIAI